MVGSLLKVFLICFFVFFSSFGLSLSSSECWLVLSLLILGWALVEILELVSNYQERQVVYHGVSFLASKFRLQAKAQTTLKL